MVLAQSVRTEKTKLNIGMENSAPVYYEIVKRIYTEKHQQDIAHKKVCHNYYRYQYKNNRFYFSGDRYISLYNGLKHHCVAKCYYSACIQYSGVV